ncbi:LytTR family DNA-binding domain-containing protein [Mangrovimonas sp. TPBH4]|uniref:LytR/AlgR family response regulator transcription factor n=1 Tax=Mangrovimonas sp. TPBH4 TaxID=1645914 RepID=UPI0006B5E93D|nr:LytTR family DNA-binding domain-containing protein [Mangrovimonas sp. TPBH4]
MDSIKALIVEDNSFMATVLTDLLEQRHRNVVIAGVANNGCNALKFITKQEPDIVFLDIELPDMTGFEMLSQLQSIPFKIIFTTAHSQYAIKAFRFNALDYLVKPIDENELDEALNRFKASSKKSSQEEVKGALQNINSNSIENQRLILQTQKGYLKFFLKQIAYIESERNYSCIYLNDGSRELSSKTLAYFENVLDDKGFFRSHRSFLVNKSNIGFMNENSFVMKNGVEVPISKRKKTDAKIWFA